MLSQFSQIVLGDSSEYVEEVKPDKMQIGDEDGSILIDDDVKSDDDGFGGNSKIDH